MLLSISLVLILYGFLIDEPEPIALAGVFFFFTFPIKKYLEEGITSITPLSLYAIIKGLASLGNLVGLIYINDPEVSQIYFKYVSPTHIEFALLLHFVGSLFTLYGFETALKRRIKIPKLSYEMSYSQLSTLLPLIIWIVIGLSFMHWIPSLGTLSTLITFIPFAAVFFLARYGSSRNDEKFVWLAFIFMLLTTLHSVLFSYLRMSIVLPAIAFILGLLIGKKSFTVLKRPILIPVYFGAFIFVSYFTFLGNSRDQVGGGLARIEQVDQLALSGEYTDEEEGSTLLSRFSNINQLSQIGRVVEEDGFYYGETLRYLVFGFIPRFIWPDKPIIQQGAWFAFRIEMGRLVDGHYTNSIDMTPGGELFLNFGWIGVVIGSIFLGFFIGTLWKTTDFWATDNNVLGGWFGFYLLYLGLFSFGADLQILLTLLATYITFIAVNWIIGRKKIKQNSSGRISS